MKYVAKTFTSQKVRIDNNTFVDCSFKDCDIYCGGPDYTLENPHFHECRFHFDGYAGNAMLLLEALSHDPIEDNVVVNTFPHLFKAAQAGQ